MSRQEASVAGERLEMLVSKYEDVCDLTSLELRALDSRKWAEMARLEGMRRELFSQIVSSGVFVPPPEPSEDDAEMIEKLRSLVLQLTELGKSLSRMAKDEMDALLRELRSLDERRKALKVYCNPRSRGALFIDGNI